MNLYLSTLRNFMNFSGRARRREYWMFVIFTTLLSIVAAILDNLLYLSFEFDGQPIIYGYLSLIFHLITLLPAFAVAVRRLHDVGKSGWFLLIDLIPVIGPIWLLVLFFTPGEEKINKWGPNPKSMKDGDNSFIRQF